MALDNKNNTNSKSADVFFIGKDLSIYNSLKSLNSKLNSLLIEKVEFNKNIIKKNKFLIIDDSIEKFSEKISFLEKEKFSNFFILLNPKKINIFEKKQYKFFLKPLKVFELNKEIIRKISNIVQVYDQWKLDRSKLKFFKNEKCYIKLTEKEFYFILLLLKNKGSSLPKNKLLNKIWKIKINNQKDLLDTRVVETLVSNIRKKLKNIKKGPKIIKDKSGYKLLLAPSSM